MNTREKGTKGEDEAVDYIRNKGWRILDRNYRINLGEIDIIAMDKKTVVFVEVKTWRTIGSENLEYVINQRKRKKIIMVSRDYFMKNKNLKYDLIRYDVIFIGRNNSEIDHYKNAFTETGEL